MPINRIEGDPYGSTHSWDCVWVGLKDGDAPIGNKHIQVIDWKLGGVVSRFLLAKNDVSVFVPTMGRLPFQLLFLNREPFDSLNALLKLATVNHWKSILAVVDDKLDSAVVEKLLGKVASDHLGVFLCDGV